MNAAKAAGAAQQAGKADVQSSFAPLFRVLTYVGLVLLGFFLGALGGYVAGAGLATIVGMASGIAVGLLLALCVTGDCGHLMDEGREQVLSVTEPLIPGFAKEAAYGHEAFSLLVTIHEIRSAAQDESAAGGKVSSFDAYVVLNVGDNPEKCTCVRKDGIFQETFKVKIRARDQYLKFAVRDQEVFIDSCMGKVAVGVNHVIDDAFPCRMSYILSDGDKKVGRLVLSFDWCEDFPINRLNDLQQRKPAEFERRMKFRDDCLAHEVREHYGTFGHQQAFGLSSNFMQSYHGSAPQQTSFQGP